MIGVGGLLRMVANSSDARAWLGWLTPSGWLDQVRAVDENRWPGWRRDPRSRGGPGA